MKKKKTALGRPSKYSDKVLACAQAYLCGEYKKQGNAIPSIAGLAFALGVSRECVYEWGRVYPEFSDILANIGTAQEMLLLDGGLTGDFNSTITKLMLTKHGYSDKQETAISGGIQVETKSLEDIFK
ncbi:hypothetical protein BHC46_02730 [Snodgrassella alvi]|jgi:hypothetical protein|uniref:Uncharacterized protein n=1 Tax=Snodgrassella alvi TaxID=1196083 RepID=A0A2N9XLG3_9NEIS|nr:MULTISPECIES: terminase small subunit [Snodgrassella]PIT08003.1 hypothetical protein BGI31_08440 [Snodgrassella communis]PIT49168.1 hypothetical protein BHC46_02730 [Snodgrassella alvi]